MSQKTAVPFFTNANGTQTFFSIKMFCQEMGTSALRLRGPSGPTPIFRKKVYKKNCCVSFEVCKKWHCHFFQASDLPQDESVRVWAFLACKKIEIRVMWTFTASKMENQCSFLRVRSSAEKLHSFSEVFLSCGNITDLLKATPISKKVKKPLIMGYPYHTKIVKNY